MKRKLTDDDRNRLDTLVIETEKRTNTQIVLAVIQRSDSYAELPWKAFALGASISSLLIFILTILAGLALIIKTILKNTAYLSIS